jgi:hypothetical protein
VCFASRIKPPKRVHLACSECPCAPSIAIGWPQAFIWSRTVSCVNHPATREPAFHSHSVGSKTDRFRSLKTGTASVLGSTLHIPGHCNLHRVMPAPSKSPLVTSSNGLVIRPLQSHIPTAFPMPSHILHSDPSFASFSLFPQVNPLHLAFPSLSYSLSHDAS